MASVEDLLKNQDFLNLPPTEIFRGLRQYQDFAGLPAAAQTLVVSNAKKKFSDSTPKDKGFFSTLADDITSIPGAIVGALPERVHGEWKSSPTLQAFSQAQHGEFEKGRQAFKKGDYVEGAARTAAGAIPLAGPMAAQLGEEVGAGQYGQAAAHGLELFGPEIAKLFPKGIDVPIRTLRNVNNPVEEAALKSVEQEVRMTPEQRFGHQGKVKAQRDLQNVPQTEARAAEYFGGQQEDIAAGGRRRASLQPGQRTNPYGAGEGVQQALKARIDNLKAGADKLYDSVRDATSRNVKNVQVGTDPSGAPVMKSLESPVALGPIRQSLKPIYEQLKMDLPEAKKLNSPAYKALENFMTSGTQQMNAMDFDRFLGAVKAITRDGNSTVLSTQSQRLARQIISAGEKEFKDAIAGAGPNVVDELNRARKAVREYHETAEFLDDLHSEPGKLYDNLTSGGDRVQLTLQYLKHTVPDALNTVARTYLEELMNKATAEGGWSRSGGVLADWNRLGPETKQLLFGPELSKNLDEFLLAAKRLVPAEGSATAGRLSAIAHYGDFGLVLSELLGTSIAGHPLAGIGAGAGILAKTRLHPEIMAHLAFKPAGAAALKQVLTLPVNSVGFTRAMRTLQTLNALGQDQEKANQAQSGDQNVRRYSEAREPFGPLKPSASVTTYGDAESRFTRTPIEFGEAPSARDLSGFTYYDDKGKTAQDININTGQDDLDNRRTLRHENIHAALAGVDLVRLAKDPELQRLAAPIKKSIKLAGFPGPLDDELPAYLGAFSNDPTEWTSGVDPKDREAYVNAFVKVLGKTDPRKAVLYRRMVNDYSAGPKPTPKPSFEQRAKQPFGPPTSAAQPWKPRAEQTISATPDTWANRFREAVAGEGTAFGNLKEQFSPGRVPFDTDLPWVKFTANQQHLTETGAARGFTRGLQELLTGLTSSKNIAMMLTGGLAKVPAVIDGLVSGYFSADMILGAIKQSPELLKYIRQGDTENATRLLTEIAGSLAMATGAGSHSIGSLSEAVQGFRSGEGLSLHDHLQSVADKAAQSLKDRGTFNPNKARAGIDHRDMKDVVLWGAAKIAQQTAQGVVKAGEWRKGMIKQFGAIPPDKLDEMYAQSKEQADRANQDVKRRSLDDMEVRIPQEQRMVSKDPSMTLNGKKFHELDLDKPGPGYLPLQKMGVEKAEAQNQSMWDKAISESEAAGGSTARRTVESTGTRPPDVNFINDSLKQPDRSRYWYEVSGESFTDQHFDVPKDVQPTLIDMIAATSGGAKPTSNMQRAIGVMSEWARKIPSMTDLREAVSPRRALDPSTGAIESRKYGSFSGTMQLIAGLTKRRPLPVNDVQVASMFGITGDQIAKNPILYEVISRYLLNLRDAQNAALNPSGKWTRNSPQPYESWQIQAPMWTWERERKDPGSTYDDYSQVMDRDILPRLRAAGVPLRNGKITMETLRDPRTRDLMSPTAPRAERTPVATVETVTTKTPAGSNARTLYDKLLTMDPQIPWVREAKDKYQRHQRAAMEAIGERYVTKEKRFEKVPVKDEDGNPVLDADGNPVTKRKALPPEKVKNPSLISQLMSAMTGQKMDVARIDTTGHGTYMGEINPNMRIPLGGTTSNGWRALDDVEQNAFIAYLGRWLKQDGMARSLFKVVDPGKGDTHSVFLQSYADKVDQAGIEKFGRKIGLPINVTQTPTGVALDIVPEAGKPVPTLQQVHDAATEIWGKDPNVHWIGAAAQEHSGNYINNRDYNENIEAYEQREQQQKQESRRSGKPAPQVSADDAAGVAEPRTAFGKPRDIARVGQQIEQSAETLDQNLAKWQEDTDARLSRHTAAETKAAAKAAGKR